MTKFSVLAVLSFFLFFFQVVSPSLAFVVVTDRNHHGHQKYMGIQGDRKQTATMTMTSRKNSLVARQMFGGMFGGGDKTKEQELEEGQLALYPNLANGPVKFQSLSDYITNKWVKLFETGTIKLTTPVRILPTTTASSSEEEKDENVVAVNGVKLVFVDKNTGYKSRDEEEQAKSNDNSNSKKRKQVLQGGVEILVELVADANANVENQQVRVRAQRCDFDEDTMIKEMSEEAILQELRTAIDVWKREAASS